MKLDELRDDCALKQKKGLHIVLASIVIWIAVLCVHLTDLPILTKNLLTFCCTAPLLPLSFFLSKIIKVDFQNKENPLTNLGVFIFCKSNSLFTDCNVGLSNCSRKIVNGDCYHFWSASYALQLAV